MVENLSLVAQLLINQTKALVAIQELHGEGTPCGPRFQCCECFHIWPCATRRFADEALKDVHD